ncbi:LicD family protein [uncultured Parabacteroides sp.]|uniref:LicD family protein n=1 Tax=uncultured Parabacteroides sp. TaxID=512312 RepID=UPI00263469D1|nr:LicD family protein [uncultured Parabacteroides sp.]
MVLSIEQKELYVEKILEIAKYFDNFCSKHGLRYFAIGGTAIGALRHHGMIPWDDDIDFVMPRPDYERFLMLSKKELSSQYDIFEHRMNKSFHQSICKMCDANTSYLDSWRYDCVLGAFIDIFPMDGMPDTNERGRIDYFLTYYQMRRIAEAINTHYSFRDLLGAIYHMDIIGIKSQIYSHFYHLLHKDNDIYIKCDNYLMRYPYETSEYVAYFGTNKGINGISKREWFNDYYYVPFEDFQVRLPIGIDKYLTRVYGDYMTPLPVSERGSLHSFGYLNLNERVPLNIAKSFSR